VLVLPSGAVVPFVATVLWVLSDDVVDDPELVVDGSFATCPLELVWVLLTSAFATCARTTNPRTAKAAAAAIRT
jgi:hypothetical protein